MAKLVRVVQGVADRNTVVSALMKIGVRENDEHPSVKNRVGKDFLLYRYYLEIQPANAVENDKYQAAVGQLLGALWRSGWDAVALCDFRREFRDVRRPACRRPEKCW